MFKCISLYSEAETLTQSEGGGEERAERSYAPNGLCIPAPAFILRRAQAPSQYPIFRGKKKLTLETEASVALDMVLILRPLSELVTDHT